MKLIYLDIETTGIPCPASGLIQLAGEIEIDGEVRDCFNFHVRPFPQDEISDEALSVNGITREELAAYEEPQRVFEQFVDIMARYVDRYDRSDKFHLVAYNARFDADHLRAWFEKIGDKYFGSWFWHPVIDVMNLAAFVLMTSRASLKDFKLVTVAAAMGLHIDDEQVHDAAYDAGLTRQLFHRLMQRVKETTPQPPSTRR